MAHAQIGNEQAYAFLDVPSTARLSALGGVNVSLADRDAGFFTGNPALTGDTLSDILSINYQLYLANVGQFFLGYTHPFKTVGTITFGLLHIRYGDIQGYDINGTETGYFSSGETAFILSKQHQVSNFRMGVNFKGVFSNIAGYRSAALMVDLGGIFIHPTMPLIVGVVIKNPGIVINDYSATANTRLPFDVQVGATFKPEHMPVRFSFTAYNLTKDDVSYNEPDDEPSTIQKILNHVNIGMEILIHKHVTAMAGYNFLTRQALKFETGAGGAGISVGLSASVKSFELVVGRSAYSAGNAGYSFTLLSNINKILKRQ